MVLEWLVHYIFQAGNISDLNDSSVSESKRKQIPAMPNDGVCIARSIATHYRFTFMNPRIHRSEAAGSVPNCVVEYKLLG